MPASAHEAWGHCKSQTRISQEFSGPPFPAQSGSKSSRYVRMTPIAFGVREATA
jgi:hypothetical protein